MTKGLAITGYGVGAMLAQFSGGLLTDRIGRGNAIAISMITCGALVLLLLEARSLLEVFAVVIVYSFFAELHRPASGALIADLVPPEHRVAAYAFNRLLSTSRSRSGSRSAACSRKNTYRRAVHRRCRDLGDLRGDLARRAPPRHPEHEAGGPGRSAAPGRRSSPTRVSCSSSRAILAGGLVYAQGYSTFPLWVRDLGIP